MTTIEQKQFERCVAEGRPYLGRYMHAFQGNPVRHGYMALLVKKICGAGLGRPLRILEIGSWAGGSAMTWAGAIDEHHGGLGQVVCIDSWRPYFDPEAYSSEQSSIYRSMHRALESGDILQLFLHNIRSAGFQENVVPMIGESRNILPLLADASFDVVFIDGAHDYENVCIDVENARRLVAKGGVLCGDDLEAQLFEVDADFCARHRSLDFVCEPESNRSYHPGVTLAVGEFMPRVSSWEGFWAVQKSDAGFVCLPEDYFSGEPVKIPEHIPVDLNGLPELVLHGHREFNVIRYLDAYWGVAQRLGPMDLTTVDATKVEQWIFEGVIKKASTLEAVVEAIDQHN